MKKLIIEALSLVNCIESLSLIAAHLDFYAKKAMEGGIVTATLGLCTDHLKALT